MRAKTILPAVLAVCVATVGLSGYTAAQEQASATTDVAQAIHGRSSATSASAKATPNATPAEAASSPSSGSPKRNLAPVVSDAALRVEGEKRFQTNCGRCHQPPHKFPPQTMATIIRHMRVRAMITDEDMRLILRYMTQ